jgi:hypothetical protein
MGRRAERDLLAQPIAALSSTVKTLDIGQNHCNPGTGGEAYLMQLQRQPTEQAEKHSGR